MSNAENSQPSLQEIIRIFQRRRRVGFITFFVVLALAVLACIFMTRRYQASGVIELQKSSSDALDLQSMMGDGGGGAGDSLSANLDLQTQADILKSDTLALKVIKDMNLEDNKDFKSRFNPLHWVFAAITPKGTADPVGVPIEYAPHRRVAALKAFAGHLAVRVHSGTRLIDVSFSNRDPKVAAAVVNHLFQGLIDFTFQTKFNATTSVSQWLEGQLSDLRKQSADLESKVVQMQKDTGLFGVGATDMQGKPVIFSPVLDRLQASTTQYSGAELNRIVKQSVYQVASSGDPELISQLVGTTMASSSGQGVQNSLTLIQNLRQQEATLDTQVKQDAAVYGSAYPKLVEERASLDRVHQLLQEEVKRIGERARTDYEVALKAEQGLKSVYQANRSEAEKLNDKTIEYTIAAKEADQSQELYQDLLKRLKEAGIVEGLKSSNISVVVPASEPDSPHTPNVPVILALGVFFGGALAGGACLLADALDNKVQGVEEVEAIGAPLLGILPQLEEKKNALLVWQDAEKDYSPFVEAIRNLRSTVLLSTSGDGKPPKVILVTSGSPAEGKSTISFHLAVVLSQMGKSVLLIEGDLRRPGLSGRLGIHPTAGLGQLLAASATVVTPLSLPGHDRVKFLAAGPVSPYPAELLASQRMMTLLDEWKSEYDFIVIDSAPVLAVSDALAIEKLADTTVLVARSGQTTRIGLKRSLQLLVPHAANPAFPAIGVLLNGVPVRSAAYYGYYGYYGSTKYGYEEKKSEKRNEDA